MAVFIIASLFCLLPALFIPKICSEHRLQGHGKNATEGDGHVAIKLCFLQPFFFKDLFIYLLCVCMLISVSLCKPHICRCPRRPEGITCFRTGVTGSTRNETHPPARAARALTAEPSPSLWPLSASSHLTFSLVDALDAGGWGVFVLRYK